MRSSVPVGEGLNHKENPVAQDHARGGEPGGRGSGPRASADLACGTAKLQGDVAGTPNANGSLPARTDPQASWVVLFSSRPTIPIGRLCHAEDITRMVRNRGWSPILRWSLDPGSIGRRTETSGPARARPTTRTPWTSTDIPSEDRATIQRRSRGRAGHGPAR
jgi:hypothetical protein